MPVENATFSSSMIDSAEWDSDTGDLTVTFVRDGSSYDYHGVPAAVWKALQSAASPGRYFADNIKTVY